MSGSPISGPGGRKRGPQYALASALPPPRVPSKKISRDAGAGPTAGPVGTTTGPPTSAMGAADSSTAASAAAAESALNRNDGEGTCCNLMDCRPTQSRMVGDHY